MNRPVLHLINGATLYGEAVIQDQYLNGVRGWYGIQLAKGQIEFTLEDGETTVVPSSAIVYISFEPPSTADLWATIRDSL